MADDETKWSCKIDGRQVGPISTDQLRELASEGTLSPDSEVKREYDHSRPDEWPEWQSAKEIEWLFPNVEAPVDDLPQPTAYCPECQGEIDQTAAACPHCGNPFGQADVSPEVTDRFRNGANWFFWIACLTVINSVLTLSGNDWQFIIGLGVTQVIDGIAIAIAKDAGMVITLVACGLDIVIVGFVVGIGVLARKGIGWAFILGMILYAIDGLIFVLVQDWLGVGLHVFVLFCIWAGLKALWETQQSDAAVIQTTEQTSR